MRVIARTGMAAATIAEIAQEANIAKGTIYLYFRDRDELVEKTFETAMALLGDQIDAALEKDLPFEDKLREAIAVRLAFFRENREFFRLYLSLRMPEGTPQQQRRHKRTCHPQYRTRVQKFAEVLKEAMERGEIRHVEQYRLALFVIEGSTAVILDRLTEETPPPEEDDVEFMVRLILDGVRKR